MVRRRRRSRRGGFTLIELLISMGLSMVGLLGLVSLQMVAIRGNMAARAFTEATSLAQERQEYLMTESYTDLLAGSWTEPLPMNAQGVKAAGQPYTRTTTVAACTGIANCIDIRVAVSWDDFEKQSGGPQSHKVTLYQRRTP